MVLFLKKKILFYIYFGYIIWLICNPTKISVTLDSSFYYCEDSRQSKLSPLKPELWTLKWSDYETKC